jgi:hypothetical protein
MMSLSLARGIIGGGPTGRAGTTTGSSLARAAHCAKKRRSALSRFSPVTIPTVGHFRRA